MYPDRDTNFVYFSLHLKEYHKLFFKELSEILERNNVPFGLLDDSKDNIWCRDYMPIQVRENSFVQFLYDPDYMRNPRDKAYITDASKACSDIGIKPSRLGIRIDGGNIIRWKNKAIMTDKIFDENPGWDRPLLENLILRMLRLTGLIIIPREPHEATGHADGWVRFLDDNTVLLAEYPKWKWLGKEFKNAMENTLKEHGLEIIRFPSPVEETASKKPIESAKGCYINYLHVGNLIILPVFKMDDDDKAFKLIGQLFPGHKIETIYSNAIAKEGGVLNCISWNVYRGEELPVRKRGSNDGPFEPVMHDRSGEEQIRNILRVKDN